MNSIIKISSSIAMFLVSQTAIASTPVSSFIKQVMENNMEIKSLDSDFKQSELDIRSTNNIEATSIDFEYSFGSKAIGDKYAIGIAQPFAWPGLYHARGKANSAQISAIEYLTQSRKLDILNAARQLCIDLVYVNKQISLQSELVANMRKLKESYEKGFDNREISILDINKLRVEILRVDNNISTLFVRKDAIVQELKAISGGVDADEQLLSIEEYPHIDVQTLDVYSNIIRKYDPEILSRSEQNRADNLGISVAKMQGLPSFALGYKFVNELGEKFHGITASITLPFFSNRNKVASSKAKKIASQFSSSQTELTKLSKLNADYTSTINLKNQLDKYKLALNDNNLELLKKALDASQISLLTYILEANFFIEASNELLKIEYDYFCNAAKLDKYSLIIK